MMLRVLYIALVWWMTEATVAEYSGSSSCPFVGPSSEKLKKCLRSLGIEGKALLTSNPFDQLEPGKIYDICNRLTPDDITSAIQCAQTVRDGCVFADVTEEVRLIDMTGVKNAMMFICQNKDLVNYGPAMSCLDLQKGMIERCIRLESDKSFAELARMGKSNDKIANRCTKLRVSSYCYETVLLAPCGYRLSVFKRTVMDHMIPQTCNCRKEYYDRERDPEDCYDESDCLEHLRPGMVEKDLYQGVVLGMQTLADVEHFCDYHDPNIVESRITKGIKCIERANQNCTYKSMRFKHMRIDTKDLIAASTLICDRVHTFEQYRDCFERGQKSFKKCEENQWMIEKPHLRAQGFSDNLEEFLMSKCRSRRRCVEHTFRVCSVMLLDVLEEVDAIISPVMCKECQIKGSSIIVSSRGSSLPHRKPTWIVSLLCAVLFRYRLVSSV